MNDNCVKLWKWNDAPDEYKSLSEHGGDEDWVIHCPADCAENNYFYPYPFSDILNADNLERNWYSEFGHSQKVVLDDGSLVVIFAHA